MPLFFHLKRPIEATVDIVALTGTVGYLTYIWSQVDEVAAWGMVPYLGWLSFATYLSVCNRIMSFALGSVIADHVRYRLVLATSTTGASRTRRLTSHHRIGALESTPNT